MQPCRQHETFEQLMRASYEEVGIDGSPVRIPALIRKAFSKLSNYSPDLVALTLWGLHKAWSLGARAQSHPMAKNWGKLAGQFTLEQLRAFCYAVSELDGYPTFQRGCRELGFGGSLEAMIYRAGFLDTFFEQGPWAPSELSHPHQRPHYFVPGVPAQRLYRSEDFAWTEKLESASLTIREELYSLLADETASFGNYRTEYGNLMPGWNAFHFFIQGERVEQNCLKCPKTAALLDSLPGMEREFILFSALNPNSRIVPHVGAINGILRFHLPLIVPEGCGLRVGGETTTWEEGKVLVFDDSFVHEVWNQSEQLRVVLFINAWHPCLSAPERRALSRVQECYDRFPFGKKWKEAQESLPPGTLEVPE